MKCLLLRLEVCAQRALIDDVSALWVHLCRLSLPALGHVPISCVSSWSRAALASHQCNLPKASSLLEVVTVKCLWLARVRLSQQRS